MALTLKINIVDLNLVKAMNFDPKSTIVSACEQINKKLQDTSLRKQFKIKEYGLFCTEDDPRKGTWLEPGRTLEYYMLKDHSVLEFKSKMRTLRVRMLDGTVKTIFIDDSQPVANLMVVICTKIGITNHEEYSLVRENTDKSDKENMNGTYSSIGTLKKNRDRDRSVDNKMEQLKKKLKTDDDLNWVDLSKTLREQGIDDEETLLLRRKFFYSDSNIDSRDPIGLNLLYVQTRDAIVNGTHPVTIDQASQFAGIQCQIQYGNYDESKHKIGFLELKELLPKDYSKIKQIEKRIFTEHSKYAGFSDLDAKVKYVQLARSLKTYGVTFFLVKEKMQGKNKLVPRLLGVTKDSVLRLDEQTKNILETWPLNTVKRWAASTNSFTLDFGDYKQSYYSVQTSEGEQISQLIAGYIDIILKRKQEHNHFGIAGDEGSTMVEDSVSPYKATILQHQSTAKPTVVGSIAMPAVMRLPQQEPPPIYTGSVPETRVTTIKGNINIGYAGKQPPKQPDHLGSDLTDGQHALLGVIEAAKEVVKEVEKELEVKAEIPDLGEDTSSLKWKQVQLDVKKQNVVSQLHAISGASAAIITQTAAPLKEQDLPQIGAAVATITSNLPELSKDLKILAALMNDNERSSDLIDAARRLCRALDEMLRGIGPDSKIPRMDVLKSASKVGETSQQILSEICNVDDFDKETYDILLRIAKGVATAAASLVLKAKDIANQLDEQNPEAKNRIISSAKQCALASHQLVACTKVVAPTIKNSTCQRQLTDTCREVSKQVDGVVQECRSVPEDVNLGDLKDAAAQVGRALNDMLSQVNLINVRPQRIKEEPVEAILEATDKLFSSQGDANEMVKQARVLASATTQLINEIKGEAKSQPDRQNHLLAAAKVLADATSKLVDAAKGCVKDGSLASQTMLKKAAEDLRVATNNAASNAIQNKQIKDLCISARECTAKATQNIVAVHGATGQYQNSSMEEELKSSSARVSDMIKDMVEGMRNLVPEQRSTQMEFVRICERFVGPAQELADISRSVVGTIKSESSAIQLSSVSNELSESVSAMKSTIDKAQHACESTSELDSAIDTIKSLITQVQEYKLDVNRAQLQPLPGESSQHSQMISQMNSQCKLVNQAMTSLINASSSEHFNEKNILDSARELSSALRTLLSSVRGVASTTEDNDLQMRILDNTKSVLVKSITLFEETKWVLSGTFTDTERSRRLSSASHNIQHALNSCIFCVPDIDNCVRTILELSEKFNENNLPSQSNRPYGEHTHTNLRISANRLLEQAGNILEQYPHRLIQAAEQFTNTFKDLYNSGIKLASFAKASSPNSNQSSNIITSLQQVANNSSKFLIASKNASSDQQNPLARNELHAACKSVIDSVNDLLSQCAFDQATSATNGARPNLDDPNDINKMRKFYIQLAKEIANNTAELVKEIKLLDQDLNNENYRKICEEATKPLMQSITNLIAFAKISDKATQNQQPVIDAAKQLTDQSADLLKSVKQPINADQIGDQIKQINITCRKLISSIKECTPGQKDCENELNAVVDTIGQSIRGLEDHFNYSNGSLLPAEAGKNFINHQTRMVNSAKELAKVAQEIVIKCSLASPPVPQLTQLNTNLSKCYEELAKETYGAIESTGNLDTGNRIKSSVQDLGNGCIRLIRSVGDCQSLVLNGGSIDTYHQQQTAKSGQQVQEQVGFVLAALASYSRGTQACINAVSTIQGIIGDINTTILFATAGTLNSENDSDEFSLHREAIVRTARNLAENTKVLISSSAASQEQLALSVQDIVETLKQLADVVKQGAASFGSINSEAQVLLLNSIKDVATALSDMIQATRLASGKNPNDMSYLKDASSLLVENVSSLLKTVKAVEDEHTRGTRALETTIESIDQELRAFDSGDVPKRKATPEQLINSTKPVTLATSKAVSAGNSMKQEDVIVAANMGRKAISDLLVTVKQAAWDTDQPDDRRQVLDIGRECALQYRKLLEVVHGLVSRPINSSLGMSSNQHQTYNKERQLMIDISRNIAATITRIGTCAEHLKGPNWYNPNDPTVIAESELLGASSSIEAAAMKLASLRPRRTSVRLPDEDMNFDEMILEAAKCITAATAALLKAASSAQRELNAIYGSSSRPAFHDEIDGQWSNGLISAARHVAAATDSLVESANALVQGNASEEKLISAAKQVASSTASLLVACKVKSGQDSTSMNRLQQAGNSVKKATEMLVRAAQKAKEIADEEDEQSIVISKRKVPGIAQEIVAREEIIKKEKELEEAREKLALIYKSKYTNKPNMDNGFN